MFKKLAALSVVILAVVGCKSNARHVAHCNTGCVSNFESVNKVYFAYNSSNLECACKENLKKQAAYVKKNPCNSITVEGHADIRGTREYNLALGARRANAVKHFLVAEGIDAHRIKAVSYGKERPCALGNTEQDHSLNRRAVTILHR